MCQSFQKRQFYEERIEKLDLPPHLERILFRKDYPGVFGVFWHLDLDLERVLFLQEDLREAFLRSTTLVWASLGLFCTWTWRAYSFYGKTWGKPSFSRPPWCGPLLAPLSWMGPYFHVLSQLLIIPHFSLAVKNYKLWKYWI